MSIDVEASYRQYGPMVLRRCRRLLQTEENAVEAMQDTFVQLLRYQNRLENESVPGLLHRMATNICLNRIRSVRRHPETPDEDLLYRIASAQANESQLLARLQLGTFFGSEKASTGTIAVLHLLDGFTLEEVAKEVGLSVSGVRKRLRSLKRHIAELEVQ